MMARIGIFGGTFDPVHYGHLILAERCREQADLDRVIFVPANRSPLKQDGPLISDSQRLDLLNLAIAGHDQFEISRFDIERSETSYTVETLRHFAAEFDAELYFLLGSDSLAEFNQWKSPAEICKLAQLLVVNRPGDTEPDFRQFDGILSESQVEDIRRNQVQSPLIEISSSQIRSWVGSGKSIRFLLPRAVEKYIETHQLYQP